MHHRVQAVFWCPCGAVPRARGLCARCYFDWHESQKRFAGLRDQAFKRDQYRCTNCGNKRIIEHHRSHHKLTLQKITTLCTRCHPKVHRTIRQRYGHLTPWLKTLWAEAHPDIPEQVELELDPPPEQPLLLPLAENPRQRQRVIVQAGDKIVFPDSPIAA